MFHMLRTFLTMRWDAYRPNFLHIAFFSILFWLRPQTDQHTISDNCVYIWFDGWYFINYDVDRRPRHKRPKIIRFSIRVIICRFIQLTFIETLIHLVGNMSNDSKTIKYYFCILQIVFVPNTEYNVLWTFVYQTYQRLTKA